MGVKIKSFIKSLLIRELAEWFKATSLSLVKGKTFICSNHIFSDTQYLANMYIITG